MLEPRVKKTTRAIVFTPSELGNLRSGFDWLPSTSLRECDLQRRGQLWLAQHAVFGCRSARATGGKG
jgi:hypothetical protein